MRNVTGEQRKYKSWNIADNRTKTLNGFQWKDYPEKIQLKGSKNNLIILLQRESRWAVTSKINPQIWAKFGKLVFGADTWGWKDPTLSIDLHVRWIFFNNPIRLWIDMNNWMSVKH